MRHHAYLLEGSQADFESLKGSTHPYVAQWHERFGIDDARKLIEQSALRREGESTYLIGASTIATEAQQALLKLFEEPREGLHFVLVVPHGSLLPTLRSRMSQHEKTQEPAERQARVPHQAAAFLKASGKGRSDIIVAMLKDEEGVKERVRELLDGLEMELYKRIADPSARAALSDIAMVRDYVRDRSPSLKMLLEHLALAIPNT